MHQPPHIRRMTSVPTMLQQTSLHLLDVAFCNMQTSPTPLSLRSRLAAALNPYITSPLYASYILDTSPANALQVLSSPTSLHGAITAAHSESAISPCDDTSFDFSYASEHLILPQFALGDAYMGVVISRHATIPSAAARPDGTPFPESELRSGRFIADPTNNTLLTIAHNPQSSLSYGLFITPTSPTTRDRILFRVPTANMSSISESANFLALATETHPAQTSPAPAQIPCPSHPTDFRNFTFATCPLIGAFRGTAVILRPDNCTSPQPLTSFCEMRGFSATCAVTADTHARVAGELHSSAMRTLGSRAATSFGSTTPLLHHEAEFEAPFPGETISNTIVSAEVLNFLDICSPVTPQKPSPFLSDEIDVCIASQPVKSSSSLVCDELPPSLQRRNIRKRTEAEEIEREGRRTSKNRAAAARANARRRFVRTQLDAAERRVLELERKQMTLLKERKALRESLAAIFQGRVFETVQAA